MDFAPVFPIKSINNIERLLGQVAVLAGRYKVAGRDIVSESFDGDIVVLDLNSGKYFSFTDSGSVIWEAVAAGARPDDLLPDGANYSAAELEAFLGKLLDQHLLAARDDNTELRSPPDEFAGKIGNSTEKPDIFVFDDLADLFKADPIHDVEESAGWPVLKKD